MASKFAAIIGDLPNLPPDDPSYQSKIEEIKESLRTDLLTPDAMAKEYQIVRSVKDDLNDQLSIVQMRLTAVEQLLFEAYENDEPGFGLYGAGPNTIKMRDGASVAVQMEPMGKVEDKEAFRLWCIANGYENALQLWPSTMNSLTKDRLLKGESAPEGVKAYAKPKIVWRKG
jgi:hypothetical protein